MFCFYSLPSFSPHQDHRIVPFYSSARVHDQFSSVVLLKAGNFAFRGKVVQIQNANNTTYMMIHTMEITGMTVEDLMDKNMEYLDEFPRRPTTALKKLIADRVGTQKELALNSGLSPATISRMCKDDDFKYSIQEATRLVVGLQLPPPLSALFLDMIGFTRAVMVKYYRYQCIIDCMFMDDIYEITESHKTLFDR